MSKIKLLPGSLKHRITMLVFVLGVSAAVINVAVVGLFQYKILKANINSAITNQVETVYTIMAESIFYQHIYDVFTKAESMKRALGFTENIYIFDSSGNYMTDSIVKKDIATLKDIPKNDPYYKIFPVKLGGKNAGYIVYELQKDYITNTIGPQLAETALFGLAMLLAGLGIVFIINRLLIKPLSYLTEEVENGSFEKIPFDFKLSKHAPDEIKTLASKIQQLTLSLKNAALLMREQEKKLQRSERLASVGTMSAGLAHQLKNPIMTIDLLSHILKSGEPADSADISVMKKESEKIVAILNDFLNISKPVEPNISQLNLQDFTDDFIETAKVRTKNIIEIQIYISDYSPFSTDWGRLKEILLNLLHNSREAEAQTFKMKITKKDNILTIVTEDDGKGMSEEVSRSAFLPFFTTKPTGTGLGLTYAEYCLDIIGGSIACNRGYSGGASFIITLEGR